MRVLHFVTIAVVVAACSRQGGITVRPRTLQLVAVNPSAHTPTLLTHTYRIGKNLSVHKYAVFKGAICQKNK